MRHLVFLLPLLAACASAPLEERAWIEVRSANFAIVSNLPPDGLGALSEELELFHAVVRKLTKKKGVDVVFEHVGKDTWAGSMLSMKRGGRLVTCGSTSGVSTDMNLMMLFQQQLKLLGSFGCRMENMANAMQKMARGLVHPVIDTEVGLNEIDRALERMESRQIFGKIILKMD